MFVILIAGVCPDCQIAVMCNVCVHHYTESAVRPLIEVKCLIVAQTKCLLSNDALLDNMVVQKGGSISYMNFWTTTQPFHLCMKNYGDLHPCVQGFIRTVMEKGQIPVERHEVNPSALTTPQFFN